MQVTEEGWDTGISMIKREKEQGEERFLAEHLIGIEKSYFFDLKHHENAPVRKERLSPLSKTRREAS